ncbi:MAG: glycosyltransferase [Acidobacteria bacterium]|jgi:glycosyltransferase involved in cell wall biosynthesis|nr:MAG: glycosyltransferase [Acidobacteriota bacterium]
MKLLDVTPYFHTRSGGIRRYLLEKSKFLEDTSIDHVLIIPGKENRVYYHRRTKVYEVSSFPIPMTGGYRFFLSYSGIKHILEEEKPNVVELGGTYQPIPTLKSDDYLLSVFYHSDIRSDLSLIPIPNRLKNVLTDYTITKRLSKAHIVITPSKRQEEFLRNYKIENAVTVNLGVDTDVFNPSKRDPYFDRFLGIKEGTIKLLYVGRLSPEKNIGMLLNLVEHFDPTLFHFVLVGDGPLREEVKRKASRIPNLTYLDFITGEEELAKVYASCDIFVSTSPIETYGLSFLEAQACGCLLVAFDMGLESQPFKDFLTEDYSLQGFYRAVIKACEAINLVTREQVASLIRDRFSWRNTFERLLEVYSGLLAQV